MFDLKAMSKKGQKGLEGSIEKAVGAVILVAIVAALSPEIFEDLDGLSTATGVPSWVPTVLIIVAGAGFVFLVYRRLMK